MILSVEDNPDDETLTLRAFKEINIVNQIVLARVAVETLDFLFGTETQKGPTPVSCLK